MDFEKAKVAAQIRLEKIIGAEITQDFFDVSYRAYILGVREEKFDWKAAIPKSTHDFDAYESLKKYCAILIGKNEPLPNELKSWLINILNDSIKPPKREERRPSVGRSENIFLPLFIHQICKDFGLKPTRNAASMHVSGCDAVSDAINSLPPNMRFKTSSYDALARLYNSAKKQGLFVGQ